MVFSSIEFLLYFLPSFFVCYFLASDKHKNFILLLFSLLFYAYSCYDAEYYILLLLFSLILNYTFSLLIDRNTIRGKISFIVSILFNIFMIFTFKYLDFFIDIVNKVNNTDLMKYHLLLPLGISFYTMQIISYLVDIYRGDTVVQKSFIKFSTYIIMFPQLVAGPIVRYNNIKNELYDKNISKSNIIEGIITFVFGLSSKVIVANQVSVIILDINRNITNMSFMMSWTSAIFYLIQLYFDFYGYSLMAIGLGKIIGFNIPKNFDLPFFSKSITEFWRRWHISLSTFLRDYVYIPLGGSKKGLIRTIINLIFVFFVSGLWHGAYYNYVLWGLFFGIVVAIERLFLSKILNKLNIISHIYAFLVAVIIFVLFANENLENAKILYQNMFTPNTIINEQFLEVVKINWKQMLLGGLCAININGLIYNKIKDNRIILGIIVIILIDIDTLLIIKGYNDPFMYFRF